MSSTLEAELVVDQRAPQPDEGDLVTVSLDGGARLLASLESISPTHAFLITAHAPADAACATTELDAELEFAGDEGMWKIDGRVTQIAPAPDADGTRVRFELASVPQLMQRRQFVRTNLSAKVSLFARNGERLRGQTLNASGGGLLIESAPDVALGDELRFALFLPGCPSVTGSCRVVRAPADGSRAVRFLSIKRETQHRLIRFLFERQREDSLHRGDAPQREDAPQRARAPREHEDADAPPVPCAAPAAPIELLNLGVLLTAQGDVAGARTAYQRAIDSLDPAVAPAATALIALLP